MSAREAYRMSLKLFPLVKMARKARRCTNIPELATEVSSLTAVILKLHGPSMFAVKAKIIKCYIIKPAQPLLVKHLVIGQR